MGRMVKPDCLSERGVSPDEGGILLQRRLGGAQRRLTRRWARNSVPFGGSASPLFAPVEDFIGTLQMLPRFQLNIKLRRCATA